VVDSAVAVSGVMPPRVSESDGGQSKSVTQTKKSGLRTTVTNIANAIIKGGCVAALAGLVAVNPTITGALSSAFSKVPAALSEAGSFIASHAAQFAAGSVIGGALNVTDGIISMLRGSAESSALSKTEDSLAETAKNSAAFNKLKSLYRSTQRRGAIQAAIGVAAVVVGGLALAGVVSNPIGLGVAAGVTAAVMLGVQIHKFRVNQQAKAARAEYKVLLEQNSRAAEPAASAQTQPVGSAANAGTSNPGAHEEGPSGGQGDSTGSLGGFGSTI
jgi:hypothetical protein